ncbi:hypothetical protein Ahy_B08g094194 [Arachis hypogaea]|uniref:Factor of DNA methylation 1-5/IDN2 domain-containing protein n=1 Tax=Arachis hypogaea TaxID=3818 RepID=A0A444Y842_ARAHY|nr:hypothetical protein Ahy_B08g094194 [Arachis hypogaea]
MVKPLNPAFQQAATSVHRTPAEPFSSPSSLVAGSSHRSSSLDVKVELKASNSPPKARNPSRRRTKVELVPLPSPLRLAGRRLFEISLSLSAELNVPASSTLSLSRSTALLGALAAVPLFNSKLELGLIMSKVSERMTESELKDYEYSYYKDLKKESIVVKISSSTYRCPFCPGKQDCSLSELSKHASRYASSSMSRGQKDKAKHSALDNYIVRYLDVKRRRTSEPAEPVEKDDVKRRRTSEPAEQRRRTSEPAEPVEKDDVKRRRTSEPAEQSRRTSEPAEPVEKDDVKRRRTSEPAESVEKDQMFVWPWIGILANIARELKGDKYTAGSGSKLRDELTRDGFRPLRVTPLWNWRGHSGFAVVEFNSDWEGFIDSMNFERSFESKRCGKKDYYSVRDRGNKIYGWVAREDDYHFKGIVGEHLRKTGDLKTVSGKEAEDKRKTTKLVSGLANTLKMKNIELEQVTSKYDEINVSLKRVMEQKEEMIKSFNDEINKMQQIDRDYLEKICKDHERDRAHLEKQKKELELIERDLKKREVQNENERRKLFLKKKNNEMAIMEQNKADEKMMRKAEQQKREKEKLDRRIHELQRQLDEKQALELEIVRLRGAVEVMKHMEEDEGEEKKKLEAIKLDLQEKEEEMEAVEGLQQTLVIRERKTNDELQDARKELVKFMKEKSARAFIHVKRMGELDSKLFVNLVKRKFDGLEDDEVQIKTVELCSQWEDYLRDANWHPFKVVTDKAGNAKVQ